MKKLADITIRLILCCFVFLTVPFRIHAAQTATLKAVVQCPAEDDSEEMTPVQGAELSIWKIAVLKDGKCIVSDDYSDIISTFQMSASENMEVSAKLSKRIKELSVSPDQTAVTDNSGIAYFAPVDAEEISVYLLQQTGASGDAEHYETMNSFLFAVPMPE